MAVKVKRDRLESTNTRQHSHTLSLPLPLSNLSSLDITNSPFGFTSVGSGRSSCLFRVGSSCTFPRPRWAWRWTFLWTPTCRRGHHVSAAPSHVCFNQINIVPIHRSFDFILSTLMFPVLLLQLSSKWKQLRGHMTSFYSANVFPTNSSAKTFAGKLLPAF